jgi:hypothetical protein
MSGAQKVDQKQKEKSPQELKAVEFLATLYKPENAEVLHHVRQALLRETVKDIVDDLSSSLANLVPVFSTWEEIIYYFQTNAV